MLFLKMNLIAAIPIWAKIYWLFPLVLFVAGNYYERKYEGREIWITIFDMISLVFISFFIIDYFNNKNESLIGFAVVPVTFLGAFWEIYITGKELRKNENNPDPEISKFGNAFCNYFGVIVGNIIVIPGYFLGLLQSYNEILKMV